MCIEANHYLSKDMDKALKDATASEKSELGKKILNQLQENLKIAAEEMIPICQDTGMAVIFLEVGQDVHFEGMAIEDAVNEGVRQGYTEGYLRKSVVGDPIIRKNTKDNTPAVIHYSIVPGDKVIITMAPKGFGSENMSRVFMLKPADGIEGVKDAILTAVRDAGPNACPPMVVGVGIGGTFEKCAEMAKHALTRNLEEESPVEYVRDLEKEDFFDAIVKERAWEFGGEKHRRYDLARWNLYGKTLYNLYFDWITLGKVARTKQYENTTTAFEEPTYDERFESYPAVAYYKMVDAVNPAAVCVSQTIDWYKEGGKNSYDEAFESYPSKAPTGYTLINMCNQYCTQVKNTSNPRQWVPAPAVLFSFYGYINESNAATVNPETDPVRYLVPIPPDALSSHQGLLKNYYGY